MIKHFVQVAMKNSESAKQLSEVDLWTVIGECPSEREAWEVAANSLTANYQLYGLRVVGLNMDTLELEVFGYVCKAYFIKGLREPQH
jgi:hypothetical protein